MTPPAGPTPLPHGFRIQLAPDTVQLADGMWFGGSPARVMRLTRAGRKAWRQLAEGGAVTSAAAGALARRLTDTGMAHPCPPESAAVSPDVTVVIPVHDRTELLDRCLAALDGRHPVVVVDDGSQDPGAVAAVVRRHGATLVRRPVNGGPAAARSTGLEHVTSELVAFLDSDCVPVPGWIEALAWHFADPLVAAVAPRVTALAPDGWAGRYTRASCSLDLGEQPARVAPRTRVSHVPTAALLARRTALLEVARDGAVFDPAMRVGEDVDLIWRLHERGGRIRYDPSVRIGHREPVTWRALLTRRMRYGTSAAPLALRHPTSVPPLVLHAWPAVTVGALLARRPVVAAAAFGMANLTMLRTLRQADVPTDGVPRAMAVAVQQTWLGTGRYATQFAAPALIALMAPGGRRRWGRRAAVASLLLGPGVAAWAARRPALDPVRFTLGTLADDIAYGTGVWIGCLTHGTGIPLRPVLTWRPLRIDPTTGEQRS
ncbi:mycofactocin biosynthesis glycosyltransferase MftF [Streptomyces sp. NPDC058001]|uniref:mycofactocin biosynthesis glycosyltransferase MftF n=1 Tax=Streptomyces sp. NPDC058001 TaxID=3346300 RepID=UPI0036E8FA77